MGLIMLRIDDIMDDKEYMNDIVYPTIGLILTVSVILLLAIKSLA